MDENSEYQEFGKWYDVLYPGWKETAQTLRKKAQDLVEQGVDINAVNEFGYTPLHIVCERAKRVKDHDQLIFTFLSLGANPNVKDKNGETPLHKVASSHSVKQFTRYMLNMLLSHGADVNAINNQGLTPLHIAAIEDSNDVLQFLMEKGGNINIKDASGKTPLTYLVSQNSNVVAEDLILQELSCITEVSLSEDMKASYVENRIRLEQTFLERGELLKEQEKILHNLSNLETEEFLRKENLFITRQIRRQIRVISSYQSSILDKSEGKQRS